MRRTRVATCTAAPADQQMARVTLVDVLATLPASASAAAAETVTYRYSTMGRLTASTMSIATTNALRHDRIIARPLTDAIRWPTGLLGRRHEGVAQWLHDHSHHWLQHF